MTSKKPPPTVPCCADCRWLERGLFGITYPACHQPLTRTPWGRYQQAQELRSHESACGPPGALFEPVPKRWWQR